MCLLSLCFSLYCFYGSLVPWLKCKTINPWNMMFELTSFFQVTQALPTRHPTPCLIPAARTWPLIRLLRVGTETPIKPLHQASTWATIQARLLSCISLVLFRDRSTAATREGSPQRPPGQSLQGSRRGWSTSHRQDREIQERLVSRFFFLCVRRIIHAPSFS